MTIEYSEESHQHYILTEIFEKGDFRNRDQAFFHCFEIIAQFYSTIFDKFNLVLFKIVIPDTKINRFYGVWRIIKEKFKLDLPDGIRSESFMMKEGELIYTCKIEMPVQNIRLALAVLAQFRYSFLVFGDCSAENLDNLLSITENLNEPYPQLWTSLINYLADKELIWATVFGVCDDVENGLAIYEPLPFAKKYPAWRLRTHSKCR